MPESMDLGRLWGMGDHRRGGRRKIRGDFGRAPKRAALWMRVSTADQRLDSQRRSCERYAAARGWHVVARFEEHGVSGAAAYRKVVDDILAGARRGAFDVVVVFRGDRAFRSAGRGCLFIDELRAVSCHFASVDDGVDTSTPAGEMFAKLVGVLAEWERVGIRARVVAGLEAARARGQRLGRPPEPGPDGAKVIGLRRRGVTWAEITKRLGCTVAMARRRAAAAAA